MASASRNQVGVDLPADLALVLRMVCEVDQVTQPSLLREVLGDYLRGRVAEDPDLAAAVKAVEAARAKAAARGTAKVTPLRRPG